MEELRVAFLVIGGVAIAGILVHGLWSVRKNSESKGSASLETPDWQADDGDDDYDEYDNIDVDTPSPKRQPGFAAHDFDDLGLGPVRVREQDPQTQPASSNGQDKPQPADDISDSQCDFVSTEQRVEVETPKPKIYSSVVTQPKPEYAAEQVDAMRSKYTAVLQSEEEIPEPPPFLLKDNGDATAQQSMAKTPERQKAKVDSEEQPKEKLEPKFSLDEQPGSAEVAAADDKVSLAEQARNFVKRNRTEPKTRKRREPKMREDQMHIDFDEPQPQEAGEQSTSGISPQVEHSAAQKTNVKPEVLVLNVKAGDDNPIQGAALLPMLLTLGFKFGEQDIFHRHVNSNGKGPVLFSLANMFKPGVFDIDNLETFSTQGVSLFMMLPIEGDPHQVFNMMHNAARKIADEFHCQVLDGRRSALTKQSLQQYVEKIREFERQRIIAR